MIVAGAIVVPSLICCGFPYLLIVGPVACGLYAFALAAIRMRSADLALLKRGWERLGSCIAASIFITVVSALPVLLILGIYFVGWTAFVVSLPSPPPQNQQSSSRAEGANQPATDGERQTESEVRSDRVATPPGPEEPTRLAVVLVVLAMVAFYGFLILASVLAWVWHLWFKTRTMFVYLLIADRGLGFREALRRSWVETRKGFWELLLLKLVTQVISLLGMQLMYVGLLATVPIGLTAITSLYEERFSASTLAEEEDNQPDSNRS